VKIGPLLLTWANLSSPTDISDGAPFAYNAWPLTNLHYDAARDSLILAYSSGTVHVETEAGHYDKRAVLRVKAVASESETWGAPITILAAENVSMYVHGLVVMPNGDYLAMVGTATHPDRNLADTVAYICKSTDGGATWTNWPLIDTDDEEILCAWGLGMTLLESGRLIAYAARKFATATFTGANQLDLLCIYSDDGGLTWMRGESLRRGPYTRHAGYEPWEPCFLDLGEGRIVSTWRPRVGQNTVQPLLMSRSRDNGATWEPLTETDTETASNPMGAVRVDGGWLAALGNRETPQPGIYLSYASDAAVWAGRWTRRRFLTPGVNNNNFGYPALARAGNKIWLVWYNGDSSATDVFELRATYTESGL